MKKVISFGNYQADNKRSKTGYKGVYWNSEFESWEVYDNLRDVGDYSKAIFYETLADACKYRLEKIITDFHNFCMVGHCGADKTFSPVEMVKLVKSLNRKHAFKGKIATQYNAVWKLYSKNYNKFNLGCVDVEGPY